MTDKELLDNLIDICTVDNAYEKDRALEGRYTTGSKTPSVMRRAIYAQGQAAYAEKVIRYIKTHRAK